MIDILERIVKEHGWNSIPDCLDNSMYQRRIEFIELACIEFARLMCNKQKEICAKKAVTGAYVKLRRKGARYKQLKDNEDFDMFNTTQMYKVEKNSILNAPYPDEIL